MELNGSTVLLTGASGNLGQALARALHATGATVKANGRRAEPLEALRSELGDRLEVLTGGIETREAAHEVAQRAGEVDVLVACAGISPIGPLDRHPPEEIDNILDVNLRAPMQMARALLPGMRERGRGHLVFISSISGKGFTPSRSVYSSTSFGLRGFAGCLRLDLHGTGIGVTTVLPGPMVKPGDTEKPDFKFDIPTERVAKETVRGIERNKGEVFVAPVIMKALVGLGNLVPAFNRFGPTEPETPGTTDGADGAKAPR